MVIPTVPVCSNRQSMWWMCVWLLWEPRRGWWRLPAVPVQQQHRHRWPGGLWQEDWNMHEVPVSHGGRKLPPLQTGLLRERLAAGLQKWVGRHVCNPSTSRVTGCLNSLIYLGAFRGRGETSLPSAGFVCSCPATQRGSWPGGESFTFDRESRDSIYMCWKDGRGVSCPLVSSLCLLLLQRWGWRGEGLAFVYTSIPADVAGQREQGPWRGAELGGGEADPPLPLHQTQPSEAGGLLCGRAEPCSAWQAIGRCKQIRHCSHLTGAGQAWASVVYRGRREEEWEGWAAWMSSSCHLLCAGGEAVEAASLGHEEGSCVVLGVIQGWLIQAWPRTLACASTCPRLWGLGE